MVTHPAAAPASAGQPASGHADPRVSVIVITRNHGAYIEQALTSLDSQTFRDFHVVVVDDNSSDSTTDCIRRWVARTSLDAALIYNERNLGMCASRNRALAACRGEFVAALSGDDYYEPDRLDRQVGFFDAQDGSVAAVFGTVRIVDPGGREVGVWFEGASDVPQGRIFSSLIRGNFLPAPSVMVRRAVIGELGGYDESLFYEDYDMWLRIAHRYAFAYQPAIVSNYRLLDSGATRSPAYRGRMQESRTRILLKWVGTTPGLDAIVIARAWRSAVGAFAADSALGRVAMARVLRARGSVWRRVALAATRLPGVHAAVAVLLTSLKRRRERSRYGANGRYRLP